VKSKGTAGKNNENEVIKQKTELVRIQKKKNQRKRERMEKVTVYESK